MLVTQYDHDIPEMTKAVAEAAFPKGNKVMKIREVLGIIFNDADFQDMFPRLGQPAESPGKLALVTILQYVENLTDRDAADAVRGRIDWKYLLGLELTDAGFHYSVLSEFRNRSVAHVFQAYHMLDHLSCGENVSLGSFFDRSSLASPTPSTARRCSNSARPAAPDRWTRSSTTFEGELSPVRASRCQIRVWVWCRGAALRSMGPGYPPACTT